MKKHAGAVRVRSDGKEAVNLLAISIQSQGGMMITGDYPVTAQSIARQAGLEHPEKVLTGPELDRLTDEELAVRIRDIQVFARVVPEQKLRIVNALKANREVVAMTGDGDNDAPALKSAQPPGKPNVGDFLTVHRRPQRKLGLN